MHDWDAQVDRLEQEATGLLDVFTTAAMWASQLRSDVRSVIDLGCGPGVSTCELARCFPGAHVTAVDSSEVMLRRVVEHAHADGVGDRVSTQFAELPAGLGDLGPADIVFASMTLHHIANPNVVLVAIRQVLAPIGLLVVIEHAPRPSHDHRPAIDAGAALVASGYELAGERVVHDRSIFIARVASDLGLANSADTAVPTN